METSIETEGKDKRLTNVAALTVVLLSVFLAVDKIKDDNIVQAMIQTKSDEVDSWTEYQAARLKLHLEEARRDIVAMTLTIPGASREEALRQTAEAEADIKKYTERSANLMKKARGLDARYKELGQKDDQFDTAEAFLSIAIAIAAIAILVDLWWLLAVSWLAGAIGVGIGLAAFLDVPIQIGWLIKLLT
jgi:hypothetical protein